MGHSFHSYASSQEGEAHSIQKYINIHPYHSISIKWLITIEFSGWSSWQARTNLLVGGFNPLESQWEGWSHILWKINKCVKPPTSLQQSTSMAWIRDFSGWNSQRPTWCRPRSGTLPSACPLARWDFPETTVIWTFKRGSPILLIYIYIHSLYTTPIRTPDNPFFLLLKISPPKK